MAEFRTIGLDQVTDISMWRYAKDGIKKRYTRVTIGQEEYWCSNTAESQLYQLLDLSVRALEGLEWQERDQLIAKALEARRSSDKAKLVLRVAGRNVWAVVTEMHALLTYTEVWGATEAVLHSHGISFATHQPVRTPAGMLKKYVFTSGYYHNGVCTGIAVFNSVKGLGALSIAEYLEIIKCHNGLISTEKHEIYSRPHKGEADRLLESFKEAVADFIKTLHPENPLIARAKNLHLNICELDPILGDLPVADKYKRLISRQFKGSTVDFTPYDLAGVVSAVAKYAPPTTRLSMEELAYRILGKEYVIGGTK